MTFDAAHGLYSLGLYLTHGYWLIAGNMLPYIGTWLDYVAGTVGGW